MYITRVQLHRIRGFEKLDLRLLGPPQPGPAGSRMGRCAVALGRNGTCKSTLLRAIAIGLCTERDAGALLAQSPGRLLTEGEDEGKIIVELLPQRRGAEADAREPMRVVTVIADKGEEETVAHRKDPSEVAKRIFMCGYGAGRAVEGRSDERDTYRTFHGVATLFEYDRPLSGIELSLHRLRNDPNGRYEMAMRGLKRALGLGPCDTIELPADGGVTVSGPTTGKEVPLAAWADGYRLTLSWLLDLYTWAIRAKRLTPDGGVRGIVLVDELEQHLHPSLQIDVLDRLRQELPDLQIISTTHSPLTALGVRPGELIVLKREGGHVVAEEHVPDFTEYSVEDVVADPRVFDAPVYAPEMDRKLKRYRQLASICEGCRTPDEHEELSSLGSALTIASQRALEVHQSEAARELSRLFEKHNL